MRTKSQQDTKLSALLSLRLLRFHSHCFKAWKSVIFCFVITVCLRWRNWLRDHTSQFIWSVYSLRAVLRNSQCALCLELMRWAWFTEHELERAQCWWTVHFTNTSIKLNLVIVWIIISISCVALMCFMLYDSWGNCCFNFFALFLIPPSSFLLRSNLSMDILCTGTLCV